MKSLIYLLIAFTIVSCTNQENKIPDNFDFGETKKGLYKNDYFGLEIKFNPDWSVQDRQEMNDFVEVNRDRIAGDDDDLNKALEAAKVSTAYLFTVFKYDPNKTAESNPSLFLVAENIKSSPGIKNGDDYLFHAKQNLERSQMAYYFEKDVYKRKIGESTFYVLEAKIDVMGETVTQEYFSTVKNGFSLSFIASYFSDTEKYELYEVLDDIKI